MTAVDAGGVVVLVVEELGDQQLVLELLEQLIRAVVAVVAVDRHHLV